jgi:hypothetical protein
MGEDSDEYMMLSFWLLGRRLGVIRTVAVMMFVVGSSSHGAARSTIYPSGCQRSRREVSRGAPTISTAQAAAARGASHGVSRKARFGLQEALRSNAPQEGFCHLKCKCLH